MPTTTLPTFQQTIDNVFTETWFDIRADAADNILESTVLTAWLKMKGCMVPQRGGRSIERTLKYAVGPTPVAVDKGDSLPQGEIETETAAYWSYRRQLATHIQRDLITDTENSGTYQIKPYVKKRTTEAMDALKQRMEGDPLRAITTDESGKTMQSLCDMIPPPASRATGTYGGINRPTTYASDLPTVGNTWMSPRYYQFNLPIDVNLVTDIKHFFNVVTNQQENPDGIVTSQTLYEQYVDFGLDAVQFIGNQDLLDLGFANVKYMGQDMFWLKAMTGSATTTTIYDGTTAGYNSLTNAMLFLNSRHIEVVYDPGLYFEMTEWKAFPTSMARLAHILVRMNMISPQLRRHGLLYQT